MELRPFGSAELERVKALYAEEGWIAYLKDDEKLVRVLDNSLFLLGAYEDCELLGFVRCVGDGEHIVLIQDLIVKRSARRRGIGTLLMNAAMERYKNVRMRCLVTDTADVTANAFYKALGFKPLSEGGMTAYFK
jgi:ribosomal protein S18 acetylase RimI-like enzyme